MGFTEMKDRNSDVKGAGDPKSKAEKQGNLLLSAIVIFSKNVF